MFTRPTPLIVVVLIASLAAGTRAAEEAKKTESRISEPIALWPGVAPGEKGDIGEEKDTSKPREGLVAGAPIIRLGNVTRPTITLFRPPPEKDTGAAVVVCPGGGYSILAYD